MRAWENGCAESDICMRWSEKRVRALKNTLRRPDDRERRGENTLREVKNTGHRVEKHAAKAM
jgi:hypothetical protein